MWRIAILVSIAALLLACNKNEKKQSRSQKFQASISEDTLLQHASDHLIVKFSKRLKSELLAAMHNGGAVNAIPVCFVKAPEITQAAGGKYWKIKRVSDRYRNPANKADSHETEILTKFGDTLLNRNANYTEWSQEDSQIVFTYYKPIYIKPLCLNCHGPISRVSPEVEAGIRKKYPNDHATGYADGDLRGMFVIKVEWPQGKQFAEQLVGDSL